MSQLETGFDIKPHHSAISVPDLEASIAWYQEMLGFTLEYRQYIEAVPARIAFIKRGDYRIEIFELDDAKPLPEDRRTPRLDLRTHGHKHICFSVLDAPEAINVLRTKGVDVVFEDVIDGVPMGFVRDNTGNLIEFIQHPQAWQDSGEAA